MRDPRPVRIPFPVALFPVPAVLQPLVSQNGHPRERLLVIDRRVTQNHPTRFRVENYFRSVYFRFWSINNGCPGRHRSRNTGEGGIHTESADFTVIP